MLTETGTVSNVLLAELMLSVWALVTLRLGVHSLQEEYWGRGCLTNDKGPRKRVGRIFLGTQVWRSPLHAFLAGKRQKHFAK